MASAEIIVVRDVQVMELGGIEHSGERVFLISTTHGAEMCGLGAFVETVKVYQELDVVGRMWKSGTMLMEGMNAIAAELGISEQFKFVGVPCSPNFMTYDRDGSASLEFRTLFVQEMIKNGVLMPWVALSYSHQEPEIALTLAAARKSLEIYKRALEGGIGGYLDLRRIQDLENLGVDSIMMSRPLYENKFPCMALWREQEVIDTSLELPKVK